MSRGVIATCCIVNVINRFPFMFVVFSIFIYNKAVGCSAIDESYGVMGAYVSVLFLPPRKLT